MATIKELKQFLDNFDENEQFFIAVDSADESTCTLLSESDIIDNANNIGGANECEDEIKDLTTALEYLLEMDNERYFYELDI